jgi:tRNA1(Val) A37 N6-methylase TrmN6
MKFDVVIGNPPYQQSANGASTRDETYLQSIYGFVVQAIRFGNFDYTRKVFI